MSPTDQPSEVSPAAQSVPAPLLQKLSPVVMDIYAAGDFHRADMRTIARESGTSFRTIYKHFQDKEKLLFWFINHWLTDLYPHAIEPLQSPAPMRERLLEVLRRHFEFYERHPQVGRIIFMTVPLVQWMKDPSYAQPQTMRMLLAAMKAAQSSGELRTDVPAVAMLDALNALFQRTFMMWEYRGRTYPLAAQADTMFQILWQGIGEAAAASIPTVALPRTPDERKTSCA